MFTAKIRIALLLLVSASLSYGENLPIAITNAAEAQAEGRELARQLCEARPETNSTMTGLLKIRDAKGTRTEIPMKFEVVVTETNWTSIYEKPLSTNGLTFHKLTIIHGGADSNQYRLTMACTDKGRYSSYTKVKSDVVMGMAFVGDFWGIDLGLEFFHWPEQRVIRKEIRRSRSCKVLESINPNPGLIPNRPDYSRVISWIDRESHGIVYAEAYDVGGKLLKEFEPRRFRKVEGQWQLQEMEIRNVQTGSRTRIEFAAPAE